MQYAKHPRNKFSLSMHFGCDSEPKKKKQGRGPPLITSEWWLPSHVLLLGRCQHQEFRGRTVPQFKRSKTLPFFRIKTNRDL